MTASDKILAALGQASRPLAVHEIPLDGVSQTSSSARLRELRRENLVESVKVPGKRWTAWRLKPADLTLPLTVVE